MYQPRTGSTNYGAACERVELRVAEDVIAAVRRDIFGTREVTPDEELTLDLLRQRVQKLKVLIN